MEILRNEEVPNSNDNEKLKMETKLEEEESTNDDGKINTKQEPSEEANAGEIQT